MPIRIEMPRLSDTMEEGTLLKWRVGVGDEVNAGDVLADVETDKATMELQAFDDGKVARLAVEEGQTTPVGSVILILAEEGESVDDAAAAGDEGGEGQAKAATTEKKEREPAEDEDEGRKPKEKEQEQEAQTEPADKEHAGGKADKGRIRVSPVARRIAEEKGLDLSTIQGSGPEGRIIKRDVLAAAERKPEPAAAGKEKEKPAAAPSPPPAAPKLESRKIKLSGVRKTIAKRLVEAKTTIPHFQVTVQVDMDPLLDLRKTLNEQLADRGVKLSVNDFIVRACATALVQHPVVNSSWGGEVIEQHGTVNIGIAVALPEEKGGGLVVPVIRNVQDISVRSINEQTRKLAEKARTQGLTIEEMADSTFTLSNLGMYGVDQFNAIINPPNAAILAVGAAIRKPVVRNDELTIGHEMSATLSCDHRVVDGATGAEFLNTLKNLLEHPALMLI